MPKIVVSQYSFTLSDPFKEGHILTDIEANVLNFTRAGLIRKIVVKWVEAAERSPQEASDGVLTLRALSDLESRVHSFDSTYTLSSREDPKPSPFERELNLIAYSQVSKMGELSNEDYFAHMDYIKSLPESRAKARELLIDKNRHIGRLEDLL